MKNLVFFFSLLLLLGCRKDISPEPTTSNQDTTSIPFLLQKSNDFSLSKEVRMRYITQVENKLAQLTTNDTLTRGYYLKLAGRYYNTQQYDAYLLSCKKLYHLAEEAKDTFYIAKSLYYLGDFYSEKTIKDSAYYYYIKAEKMYSKINGNEDDLLKIKFRKSISLLYEKNYYDCEAGLIDILKTANQKQDYRLAYDCYVSLGIMLKEVNNFDQSLGYFNKSLEILEELQSHSQYLLLKAYSYNYLGETYVKRNDYANAINYYNKALDIEDLKKVDLKLYAAIHYNKSFVNLKIGDLKKSKSDVEEALEVSRKFNFVSEILSSKLVLSEYYLQIKQLDSCVKNSNEIIQLARANRIFEYELKGLSILCKLESPQRSNYIERYMTLTDSLQNAERISRNKFARIKFETNEILNEKNTISQQRDQIALQRWLILGGSFIVIAGFAFFFYRYLQHQKRLFDKERQAYEEYLTIKQVALTPKSAGENTLVIQEDIVKGILQKLEVFEKEKRFLDKSCTLDSVAKEMETNTTYLSKVINEKKGCNFSNYINGLRIDYGIYLLENDLVFRKYSISGMADSLGFNSTASFTRAFTAKTNMRPSFFLGQLG